MRGYQPLQNATEHPVIDDSVSLPKGDQQIVFETDPITLCKGGWVFELE